MKGLIVMKKELFSIPNSQVETIVRQGIKKSMEESRAKGQPICGYDKSNKKAYIEYPNGERIYG